MKHPLNFYCKDIIIMTSCVKNRNKPGTVALAAQHMKCENTRILEIVCFKNIWGNKKNG